MIKIVEEGLPGWLISRACDSRSWGWEFESHVGCKDYLEIKSLKKKASRRKQRKNFSGPWVTQRVISYNSKSMSQRRDN